MVQIVGVVLTLVGGPLISHYGALAALGLFTGVLGVGAVLTHFIKEELRRQATETQLGAGPAEIQSLSSPPSY